MIVLFIATLILANLATLPNTFRSWDGGRYSFTDFFWAIPAVIWLAIIDIICLAILISAHITFN